LIGTSCVLVICVFIIKIIKEAQIARMEADAAKSETG
jgi:hypothetical protein